MVVADLNGDGYDEVIGGGGQGAMTELIYRYVPSSSTWEKIKLDAGAVAVSGIDVVDINGDGALDIVVIGGRQRRLVREHPLGCRACQARSYLMGSLTRLGGAE